MRDTLAAQARAGAAVLFATHDADFAGALASPLPAFAGDAPFTIGPPDMPP